MSFNLVNFIVSVSKWDWSFQEEQLGGEKESKIVFMLWGFFVVYSFIYQDIKAYPKAHITCLSERTDPGS